MTIIRWSGWIENRPSSSHITLSASTHTHEFGWLVIVSHENIIFIQAHGPWEIIVEAHLDIKLRSVFRDVDQWGPFDGKLGVRSYSEARALNVNTKRWRRLLGRFSGRFFARKNLAGDPLGGCSLRGRIGQAEERRREAGCLLCIQCGVNGEVGHRRRRNSD